MARFTIENMIANGRDNIEGQDAELSEILAPSPKTDPKCVKKKNCEECLMGKVL